MSSYEDDGVACSKSKVQKWIAEYIGCMFFIFSIKTSLAQNNPLGPLAVGTVLSVLIYCFAYRSGAHLNPAVTLGVAIRDPPGFPRKNIFNILMFMISQIMGAITGGFMAVFVGGKRAGLVQTTLNPGATPAQGFLAEFMFTFFLVTTVLHMATDARQTNASFAGAAIGMTLFVGAVSIGGITGCAINPAVWIGTTISAMAAGGPAGQKWYIYPIAHITAPILAATWFNVIYRDANADLPPPKEEDLEDEEEE